MDSLAHTEVMDYQAPKEPTTDAFGLSTALARFGLTQYEERLKENGFENWETVTAVTENDMTKMGFKLGHRRKLQRAIREYNISSASRIEYGVRNPPLPSGGLPTIGAHSEGTPSPSQRSPRTTRPYRRHPRRDHHAPQKPKTAYVLFSKHVRQDSALSSLSFADIAKETGKRWRELSHEERVGIWEKPAAGRLQDYKQELERYKHTENYQSHQTYLEGFKHGRRNLESMVLSDDRASSTSESVPLSWLPAPLRLEGLEATSREGVDAEDSKSPSFDHLHLEIHLQAMSPVKSGMDEVRRISVNLGVNTHLIRVVAFPPEDMTKNAVESFLHGTGSLLYLWDPDEALNLVRSVYHSKSDSTPVNATEVFAMSAVGSYCDGEVNTKFCRERFLHFFLCMLSSPSDICGLRRMRLFVCLAVCRFTNSVESARRLMRKRLMLFELDVID